jgi:hypothetical protein
MIGCKNDNKIVVRYYESFTGYNHPVKLLSEIKKIDSIKKESFYIGYFEEEKLVKVEKFLNGELFFTYEYVYKNDDLVKAILINKDGKESIIIDN